MSRLNEILTTIKEENLIAPEQRELLHQYIFAIFEIYLNLAASEPNALKELDNANNDDAQGLFSLALELAKQPDWQYAIPFLRSLANVIIRNKLPGFPELLYAIRKEPVALEIIWDPSSELAKSLESYEGVFFTDRTLTPEPHFIDQQDMFDLVTYSLKNKKTHPIVEQVFHIDKYVIGGNEKKAKAIRTILESKNKKACEILLTYKIEDTPAIDWFINQSESEEEKLRNWVSLLNSKDQYVIVYAIQFLSRQASMIDYLEKHQPENFISLIKPIFRRGKGRGVEMKAHVNEIKIGDRSLVQWYLDSAANTRDAERVISILLKTQSSAVIDQLLELEFGGQNYIQWYLNRTDDPARLQFRIDAIFSSKVSTAIQALLDVNIEDESALHWFINYSDDPAVIVKNIEHVLTSNSCVAITSLVNIYVANNAESAMSWYFNHTDDLEKKLSIIVQILSSKSSVAIHKLNELEIEDKYLLRWYLLSSPLESLKDRIRKVLNSELRFDVKVAYITEALQKHNAIGLMDELQYNKKSKTAFAKIKEAIALDLRGETMLDKDSETESSLSVKAKITKLKKKRKREADASTNPLAEDNLLVSLEPETITAIRSVFYANSGQTLFPANPTLPAPSPIPFSRNPFYGNLGVRISGSVPLPPPPPQTPSAQQPMMRQSWFNRPSFQRMMNELRGPSNRRS